MKSNKFWIAALVGIILLSAAAAFMLRQKPLDRALIFQNGILITQIDLATVAEPYSFTIESDAGINTISVEPGRICVTDANCHDKLCVRQGWLGSGSVPIVCLPNKLIIKLESSAATGVDAIVG